ncbi:unnamed protein product [Staurois parvus]|uniref:Uncharacterized protein n=1 Tax=Staurois parvus TaxID=386267 RepID=A0ABN9F701_9NEOB|nr:unnamed protein product [Staurois parvus]
MNTFWPRFMKKDYLLAKFYKKNTFFSKCMDFHLYRKKIKIPVVNIYHQNKVLSVSKKMLKIHMGTVLHDCAIVIQSVIALKAENWPGLEEGESDRT